MATMNGSPSSSSVGGGGISPIELAAMLRKSADVVERKEFHPLLYQTMRALTAYAGEYADAGGISSASSVAGPPAAAAAAATTAQQQQQGQKPKRRDAGAGGSDSNKDRERDPPGKKKGVFDDVPDVLGDSNKSVNGNGQAGERRSSNSSQSNQRATTTAATDLGVGLAAGRGVASVGKAPSAGGASAAAERVGAAGGPFSSASSAAGSKTENNHQTPHRGKGSIYSGLKGIKKGIGKIGAEILKEHEKVFKDDAPFDERPPKGAAPRDPNAWCDEHFTRGCMCKSSKNTANRVDGGEKQQQQQPSVRLSGSTDTLSSNISSMQQQQQQTTSKNASANIINNELNNVDKPAKPCFQRPINPSSNLIANGWIDQQRRSKMRVVWKDVLASLVEGRRPGEETTLWIQRQVINRETGKVTGLEALHQIPMKWLEDVNYVDLYGDHRFTLKVYNIAEEFYFRTRDEQSAQSWVITLRSARDASLEGVNRMSGGGASGNSSVVTEKRQKDLGLHDLDDWDKDFNKGEQSQEQASCPPQAASDGGGEKRPDLNSSPQLQPQQAPQQPEQATPVRMKVSELRAIAHGAGYTTRGMERQDLERIAAYVRSSQFHNNQAAPASAPAGSDNTEQEAVMRETEQRAAAVKREKEQAEEARRQKESEERSAVENMRKEREDAENKRVEEQLAAQAAAAEQQRKIQEEFEHQAADIKRQQEEERQRKMAELQAQERARQAQAAQQQAHEEEEQRRRQQQQEEEQRRRQQMEEEQRRRQQMEEEHRRRQQMEEEQMRRHYQQQQQARAPGTIPTPPTSGNYPQQGFQQQPQWSQQQQQHYQQQQWQQQQQQQHYQQQQGFPGQQQAHPHHPHQQFFNQNMPQQGYQQQQQQQQHAHYQQQQQQQHQQAASKYAKQMEEKDEEDQSAVTLQIKRSILINWALQPPNLNVLRPIDQLITTIHTAMPPAFGVASHAYFSKFTPIPSSDLVVSAAMGNHPDETKLKKAIRKVRVFLHPDKLPRDLTSDQQFTARMLWDITSDSWEEFQKHKDELDWIRS